MADHGGACKDVAERANVSTVDITDDIGHIEGMKLHACSFAMALVCLASAARADGEAPLPAPSPPASNVAFEANLVQPFLGITDDKLLITVLGRRGDGFHGDVMLGTYADFAWGPISRPADQYGKVWIIGGRPGYRQYFGYGFFADASLVMAWRHEEHDLHDGGTLDGFYGRLWLDGGWQVDLGPRVFLNLRGGAGVILWRTDRYGSSEKTLQPAGDVDLGVRF